MGVAGLAALRAQPRVQMHVVPAVGVQPCERSVPSSVKPALSATRQDAGLAVECVCSIRARPTSSSIQAASAPSARVATPCLRACGTTQ